MTGLTDYSRGSSGKGIGASQRMRQASGGFNDLSQLTGPNKVDVRILKDNVDNEIFGLEELKEWRMEPARLQPESGEQPLSAGRARFRSAEKRIPESAQANGGNSGRHRAGEGEPATFAARFTPRPRSNRRRARFQLRARRSESVARSGAANEEGAAPLQEKTAKALEEYKTWLQNDLLPRSDGDFRLGADKFRKKLRFALASDMSMEEIMKRAEADLAADPEGDLRNRAAALQKIFPERGQSDSERQKESHGCRARQAGRATSRRQHDRWLRAKGRDAKRPTSSESKNLVTVPDKPLKVIVMPEFKRGQGIAYCDSPGPLEKNGKTFFAVEPTPKDWTKQRKESFFPRIQQLHGVAT